MVTPGRFVRMCLDSGTQSGGGGDGCQRDWHERKDCPKEVGGWGVAAACSRPPSAPPLSCFVAWRHLEKMQMRGGTQRVFVWRPPQTQLPQHRSVWLNCWLQQQLMVQRPRSSKMYAQGGHQRSLLVFPYLTASLVKEYLDQAQRVTGVRGRVPAAGSHASC